MSSQQMRELQQQISELERQRAELQSRHATLASEIQRRITERADALRTADVATTTLPVVASAKSQAARDEQAAIGWAIEQLDRELEPLRSQLEELQRVEQRAAFDAACTTTIAATVAARDALRACVRTFLEDYARHLATFRAADQVSRAAVRRRNLFNGMDERDPSLEVGGWVSRQVEGHGVEARVLEALDHVVRDVLPEHRNLFAPAPTVEARDRQRADRERLDRERNDQHRERVRQQSQTIV